MRYCLLILYLAFSTAAFAQDDRQYIRKGNRLYHQKQYAQAEVFYRKALDCNSDNSQAAYNLGCALMMQQKDSAAIEQYQHAAKLENTKNRRAKVFHNIGIICQNHQMYDDAIKAYEQSLRCNPADDETRYNLALCKKLRKNSPQQDKNQQKQEEKNNDDQNQQKQQQDKDNKEQQQQQNQQMSKENAEQLLNAAIQNEKATQQRMKKAMQQPQKRNMQKNW